jgi:hypothetical protein
MRIRAAALLLAVLAAACTRPDPTVDPAATPAPEVTPEVTPDATPGVPPGGPQQAPPDTTPDIPERPEPIPDLFAPEACDPLTRAAVGTTVSAQLDAFAADDLAAAYALTSPFFRRVVDGGTFETLIRDEYPWLLGNVGHRLDECGVRGRRAFLVVGVRAEGREQVLRYDLSLEPDGWLIDGAMPLLGVTLPPDRVA